jgi:hypothetical protein
VHQQTNQTTDALYDKVTSITEDYLGPAANRFVSRIITNHLNKTPQQLAATDLPTLVKWARVTLGLLTEDRSLIEEYVDRICALIEA